MAFSALYRDRAFNSIGGKVKVSASKVVAETVKEQGGSSSTVLNAMLEANTPVGTNDLVLVSSNTEYAKLPANTVVKAVHVHNSADLASGGTMTVQVEDTGSGAVSLVGASADAVVNAGQYFITESASVLTLASNVQSVVATAPNDNIVYVDVEYSTV